jgi:hypothetical protein
MIRISRISLEAHTAAELKAAAVNHAADSDLGGSPYSG